MNSSASSEVAMSAGVAQPSRVAWLHTVSSPTPPCFHQLLGRKVKNLICIFLVRSNIETNSGSSLLCLFTSLNHSLTLLLYSLNHSRICRLFFLNSCYFPYRILGLAKNVLCTFQAAYLELPSPVPPAAVLPLVVGSAHR